jgi:protein-S-isoprenylcysteine O-methyltransferase Ste14
MSNEDNANVPVFPPILFGVALVAAFAARALVPLRLVAPSAAKIAVLAGAGFALLGAAFGGWALLSFLGARTTPHPNHPVSALVTSGPYRFSRNPMYVGFAAVTAGLALVANSAWFLLVLAPLVFALRRLVIDREESYLERKFGDDFRAFRARTRRWI